LAAAMAFSQTQLLTVLGVLVVLFAVIVYNNVAAMRARVQARQASAAGATHEGPVHPLLVKFVRHEGSIVGETVAIDGDRLILKQAGRFKAVPVAQAKVEGDDVLLSGSIDWAAAEQAGSAWHESTRKSDAGVSGELTKSSDVKSPALEAVRSRDERP
jgi:hypothetical protein